MPGSCPQTETSTMAMGPLLAKMARSLCRFQEDALSGRDLSTFISKGFKALGATVTEDLENSRVS